MVPGSSGPREVTSGFGVFSFRLSTSSVTIVKAVRGKGSCYDSSSIFAKSF